jgi:regulator of telomere elongation helicase 1
LLCAALAWRDAVAKGGEAAAVARATRKRPKRATSSPADGGGDGDRSVGGFSNAHGAGGAATIVYASRTHTQLAQVIKELKRTTYRPRMAVIGSRGQARSISHWSPYGRVGVVNADP